MILCTKSEGGGGGQIFGELGRGRVRLETQRNTKSSIFQLNPSEFWGHPSSPPPKKKNKNDKKVVHCSGPTSRELLQLKSESESESEEASLSEPLIGNRLRI